MPRHIEPPVSERVGLARLARDVIDSTPGVAATTGPVGRSVSVAFDDILVETQTT